VLLSRTLVGTFMAFDRHMNLVLGDTEEYRRVKAKKGQGQVRVHDDATVIPRTLHSSSTLIDDDKAHRDLDLRPASMRAVVWGLGSWGPFQAPTPMLAL
jgi:small nuclear ribonucleoprotein (snRNP)-like protein